MIYMALALLLMHWMGHYISMRKQGGTDPMIRLEIKKSIKSRYFFDCSCTSLYYVYAWGQWTGIRR